MNDVTLHESAVRSEVFYSPQLAADLLKRGNAVVTRAGGTSKGFRAVVQKGRDRYRVAIWTATQQARAAEANEHALLKALDAARQ